jgi:carbon monoxide dehydrogenase subunit G
MHLEGNVTINAPRARVWDFLTDPHQVSQCAPGVESVEIIVPGRSFRGIASVGFGSVKARFVGDVEWLELAAPDRAKMKAHGTAPGSATDVISEMKLSDAPDGGTLLNWTADISIVGQLASLAARLMAPVSHRLTSVFFDCVRTKIEAGGQKPADSAAPPPADSAAPPA